ncbi:FAD-binding oxidoreductase [Microvirga sp. VF16]|uniref:FAD-binding oxidoreductase n=1 Tax=Microvirga sp. VF16 TaxID=2807101 RepID=UPI00193D34DE|nr:FAD-binding oxidoreductase [Microvirga sp. VF16]QRM32175.1 FAD-binding oxidoreductase [Microvirga sp. VF16]
MKLLESLRNLLGDDVVLTGEHIPEKARSDASRTGRQLPMAYIRPRTVEEVSTTLRLCNSFRNPVVVQGGLTGLAGGANPDDQSIVIAMELLTGIQEIDTVAGTMTVMCGTVLEVAQQAAEVHGFRLPIDLGARGSCHIGGNLATNAGGIRVISSGMTRNNVLGLEAVLADGTVVSSLNRMEKNNCGYDLKQLFIGSEGTLGIITRAVIKLEPLPTHQVTALCALDGFDAVLTLLSQARKGVTGLSAFELMWGPFFRFSSRAIGVRTFETDCPFAVIIEQSGETTCMEELLGRMLEEEVISDALIAKSEAERDRFWLIREGLALTEFPDLIEFDVSLPMTVHDRYVTEVSAALNENLPDIHISAFGHVADGNIHLCVSAGTIDNHLKGWIADIVYDGVRKYQGSISAEHGIGTLKRAYLSYSRNVAEINLMRSIKRTLDPNGILNPGKII